MVTRGKRSAKRLKASSLKGEYRCLKAREQNREIPGAHGTLVLKETDVHSGTYELVFSCRGSREEERGSFALKGDLMELKITESNYSSAPVEGAKVRIKLDRDTLTMNYFEPETGVNLLDQVWERVK